MKKAKATHQKAGAYLSELVRMVKEDAEAYKRAKAALPQAIVNESSPVFKPLLAEIKEGVAFLVKDGEEVKKIAEKVKALTARLQKAG